MEIIYLLLLILITIVLIVCSLFFLVELFTAFVVDAPFVPIPDGIDEKIIELLHLSDTSVLYDMGCGDGRLLLKAVRKYPRIRAIGVEKAWFPFLLAKWNARYEKNVWVRREDIFTARVSDATHIFLYLYPQVVQKLLPLLRKQCVPGTRIVSCDFESATETPTEVISLDRENEKRGKKLFVYVV